nr:helix-turn-helix domain-containing protein [Streptomyces aidingensis]
MPEEPAAKRPETAQAAAAGSGWTPEVAEFVERFAAELIDAGVQPTAARVFACLLAEDSGALTSKELVARLRISPAAISGAVRYLSQVHMVARERRPGTRRELYRVYHNAWYEAMSNRDALAHRWILTLRTGIDVLGPDSRAGQRLGETIEFFEFMMAELGAMRERWRELQRARGRPLPEETGETGETGEAGEAGEAGETAGADGPEETRPDG